MNEPLYDSRTKDCAGRRWAANRMCERLPVRTQDALVIALAGEGRDEEVLAGHGVRSVISVDRDKSAVRAVRQNGGIAIQGDVSELVSSWPRDWPIHGLMMDFNSGLDSGAVSLLLALVSPAIARKCAVYINMQRGRDRSRGWWEVVGKYGLDPPTKHRGEMLFMLYWHLLRVRGLQMSLPTFVSRSRAVFNSYRARSVVMDSVCFQVTLPDNHDCLAGNPNLRSRRPKIAAARALNTMRYAH